MRKVTTAVLLSGPFVFLQAQAYAKIAATTNVARVVAAPPAARPTPFRLKIVTVKELQSMLRQHPHDPGFVLSRYRTKAPAHSWYTPKRVPGTKNLYRDDKGNYFAFPDE